MLFLLVWFGILDLTQAAVNNSQFAGWQQPRGGVVKDTLFLEGGLLFSDDDTIQQRPYGMFFELRFCSTFDVTKDAFEEIVHPLNETLDGDAPTYIDGYLFADEDEFYTYGGMAYSTSQSSSSTIFHAGLNKPNPAAVLWVPSLDTNFPLTGVTNYITNGAGVSIPSESLGFYFGGMKSSTGGNLSFTSEAGVNAADTLSDTLIEVDMTTYGSPKWTSHQLPLNIPRRAEASLAWIPVAQQGLLVAIGGVIEPADLFAYSLNDTQIQQSNATSPEFMTQVPVYDIASQTWYLQNTTGNPPTQLGQFCSVVTSASNDSSYQIYVYGGWNGLGLDNQGPSDEVWVLSVPSFKWIKVYNGTPNHGRRSHICALPAPNQMISVGGIPEFGGHLQSSLVDVFDLNALTWIGIYDPKLASDYKVPTVIEQAIRASDGSTLFANDMNSNLQALLKTPYSKPIIVNYPYTSCGSNQTKSTPTWRNAVIGGVIGGVVLILALVLILRCYRRRKNSRRHSISTYDSSHRRGFISRWIHGTPQAMSTGTKPYFSETTTEVGDPWSPPVIHEADGYFKPKYELASNTTQLQAAPNVFASHVLGSPGTPQSDIAEVASTTRYELAGSESIRNHPMYPPSLGVHAVSSDGDIVSTPSEQGATSPGVSGGTGTGTMSPYKLPQNRNVDAVSPEPDSDFNLDMQSIKNPGNLEHQDRTISPLQRAVSSPVPSRPMHRRNTSSVSSGMESMPSPNPSEDRRRSDYISSLPTHPISPMSPRQKPAQHSFEQHPQEDQEVIPKHRQSENRDGDY